MKQPRQRPSSGFADYETVIVGTGFSGLCMAIQLAKQGRDSFVLLEQSSRPGGTWRDNHYPGCACDVPSHLYSYSFAPNPRWSRMFAPQAEILDYTERVIADYDLGPHIQLDSEVTRAEFDERTATWCVHVRGRKPITARYLVFGTGPLSRPAYPSIEGIEKFRGAAFHSARWDPGCDLTGKRVAVIGTGASAIQIVPQVAPVVESLQLYQRTAPWVLPKPDRPISELERRLFAALPATQRAYRAWLYWTMELRTLGFAVDPRVMALVGAWGRRFIRKQIADPDLRAKVTPDYLPGCKRILMANDYYPALARPNVEVVTDPIERSTRHGLVTRDGTERPVDVIIYGTGFRVTDLLTPMRVIGRGGVDINDAWRDGMSAHLGTTVAGYPNFFTLLGPNTGLGHNSMIFMIEAQVHHVLQCMRAVERRGAASIEVRAVAQDAFNARLRPRLARSVWASGCDSWYLDEHGNNATTWPSFTFEFWLRTRRAVRERDFAFTPSAPAAARPLLDRVRRGGGARAAAAR